MNLAIVQEVGIKPARIQRVLNRGASDRHRQQRHETRATRILIATQKATEANRKPTNCRELLEAANKALPKGYEIVLQETPKGIMRAGVRLKGKL
jgi:hypothetical protein